MMFLTHNNNDTGDTGDSILAKVRRDPISGNRISQLLVFSQDLIHTLSFTVRPNLDRKRGDQHGLDIGLD